MSGQHNDGFAHLLLHSEFYVCSHVSCLQLTHTGWWTCYNVASAPSMALSDPPTSVYWHKGCHQVQTCDTPQQCTVLRQRLWSLKKMFDAKVVIKLKKKCLTPRYTQPTLFRVSTNVVIKLQKCNHSLKNNHFLFLHSKIYYTVIW